jgi:site-specific recombinase XerD
MEAAPTHQHYVAQFVLRNFASGRSRQIYVFDKATGKSFRTAARNVASVSGFYDFEISGASYSLDPFFQKLEDRAKEVLTKILQRRSIRDLEVDERATVAVFSTVQMLRTNA